MGFRVERCPAHETPALYYRPLTNFFLRLATVYARLLPDFYVRFLAD